MTTIPVSMAFLVATPVRLREEFHCGRNGPGGTRKRYE